jgi:hypothetical protein
MPVFKNKPRQIEAVELIPGVLMPEGVKVRVVRGGAPDAYEVYNALHDTWIKTKTGDMIRVDKAPLDVYPIDRETFDATYVDVETHGAAHRSGPVCRRRDPIQRFEPLTEVNLDALRSLRFVRVATGEPGEVRRFAETPLGDDHPYVLLFTDPGMRFRAVCKTPYGLVEADEGSVLILDDQGRPTYYSGEDFAVVYEPVT